MGTMHTEYRWVLISKCQVRKLEIEHRVRDRRKVNGREVDRRGQEGKGGGREGRKKQVSGCTGGRHTYACSYIPPGCKNCQCLKIMGC